MHENISSDTVFDWVRKSIDQFGKDTSSEMRQQMIVSLLKTLPPEMLTTIFPKLQAMLNERPVSTFTGHRFYFADPDCNDTDLAHINDVLEQAVRDDKIDVAIRLLRKDEFILPIGNQSARLHEELRDHYHYTKSSKTISRMSLEPARSLSSMV